MLPRISETYAPCKLLGLTTIGVGWSNRSVNINLKFLKDWISPWRSYLAEFLGTFVFVLVACWVVVVDSLYGNIGQIGIALAIGFMYAALVFVTAHLSGGYLNPAITLSLWLAQKLSGVKTVFLLIAQIIASFAAAEVIFLIFGQNSLKFALGTPALGVGMNLQSAVIVEAILTAVLIFAVFGTMIDRNGPVSFGPLVLGLVIAAEAIIAGQMTGAVLNPARVLAPAILAKSTSNLSIWLIGPLVGSLFAIIYDLIFIKKPKKK